MVRIRRTGAVESMAFVKGVGVEGAGEADGAKVRFGTERGCKVEEERRGRLEGPGVGGSSGARGAVGGGTGGGGASFPC